MPPAPPNSRTRRKMSSLPARTARPSIGPSSSSLACLTATTLSIRGQLGEQLGRHVDDHPRGDVVSDQRQLRDGRGDRLEVGAQIPAAVGLVVVGRDDQRRRRRRRRRPPWSARLEWRVSLVPVPQTSSRLVADLVDDRPQQRRSSPRRRGSAHSPVVPATTRPCEPCSSRWRGEAAGRRLVDRAVLVERASTIAVSTPAQLASSPSGYRSAGGTQSSFSSPTVKRSGRLADPAHGEQHAGHEGAAVDRVVADRERLALAAEDDLLVGDEARAGAPSGSARGRCRRPRRSAPRCASRCPRGRRACGRGAARRSRTRACAAAIGCATSIISTAPIAKLGATKQLALARPRPRPAAASRSKPVVPTTAWTPASRQARTLASAVSGVVKSTTTSASPSTSAELDPERRDRPGRPAPCPRRPRPPRRRPAPMRPAAPETATRIMPRPGSR